MPPEQNRGGAEFWSPSKTIKLVWAIARVDAMHRLVVTLKHRRAIRDGFYLWGTVGPCIYMQQSRARWTVYEDG